MTSFLTLGASSAEPFQVGRPLFGDQWLALLLVLGLIAIFIALVALLGRWLAATHPASPERTTTTTIIETTLPLAGTVAVALAASPAVTGEVPAEFVPVIVAAIAATLGSVARVVSIAPYTERAVVTPSIEALMQEWSYEGRRQIYSSHKVR